LLETTLKIWIKRSLLLILALIVFYAVARYIDVYTGSMITGARAPYLQMATDHSIVVRWQTAAGTTGLVRYGLGPSHLDNAAGEIQPETLHSLELDGLKADTRYYYKVSDSGAGPGNPDYDSAAPSWFRTLPLAGSPRPTRIWAIGDSGDPGPVANAVRDAATGWMAAHPRTGYPDFDVWLGLGDLAYTSGTDQQYQASLFDTYGALLKDHAFWPVYGNHDDRRWTYFTLFTLPEHAEAGGVASGSEHYYSFDYGQVHIIVLDSQDSSRAADGDMAQWLQQDLAASKSRWLIAAFHHPPYSKGTHDSDKTSDSGGRMTDMRENILPILEAGGVDLVLSGHSHMYERSYLLDCHYGTSDSFSRDNIVSDGVAHHNAEYLKPDTRQADAGTVYVVAGSSSKVDKGPINHPATPVSMLEAGSLVIDIDGDLMTTRFIDNKGEVRDQFSIRKPAGYNTDHVCVRK